MTTVKRPSHQRARTLIAAEVKIPNLVTLNFIVALKLYLLNIYLKVLTCAPTFDHQTAEIS